MMKLYLAAAATLFAASAAQAQAVFEYISYQGSEPTEYAVPAAPDEFRNPIIPGFQPDPSIVRVGKDYYLVNSSFGWLPGLPIYHSRDLVNWSQVGNAIVKTDTFDLPKVGINRGIFAPTIRWNKGVFYIITTCIECGDNFIITARNPKGPWSKPIWLKEVAGIDPDLFFDDDGRVWITNNGEPEGPAAYDGHRALWTQEYDPKARRMVGPRKVIVDRGVDPAAKPIWSEGPHILKKDGYYYLTAAEGGTSDDHSQTIYRSKSVTGPYVAGPNNPILTQRNLDPKRAFPVYATGHADFVQIPNGDWWAVFLATRPYERNLTNLGRETFLLPVTWRDGWPEILPSGKAVPLVAKRPKLPKSKAQRGWLQWRDDFNRKALGGEWLMRRAPEQGWLDLQTAPGWLTLGGDGKPSFVGQRQRHSHAVVETQLRKAGAQPGERAGLAAIADENHHYFFGLQGDKLVVAVRDGTKDIEAGRVLAQIRLNETEHNAIRLRMTAKGSKYDFNYSVAGGEWKSLLADADGRVLATEHDGLLFTGTVIGLYASRPSP